MNEKIRTAVESYRGRMIYVMIVSCLVAALTSFGLVYCLNRNNISNEELTAQTSVAASLRYLRQTTGMPVSSLIRLSDQDDVQITVLQDTDGELSDEQLSQLQSDTFITLQAGFNDMPVSYLLIDGTILRLSSPGNASYFTRIWLRIALSLFSFTVVFLLLSTTSTQLMFRPISKLTKATRQVAKGNFKVHVPDDQPGEIGELNRSFNSMAEALGKTAYLQQDFIASISHEFKTPIASIKGFARLLQMPGITEEERNEYINLIAQESDRLSRMSQTLLRLSALEQQTGPASLSTFRLDEQIRQVIVGLAPAWENMEIDWQLELNEVTLSSDEELLRQVWINLIQNAVKFSEKGGTILITVQKEGDTAVVAVTDHGIGMDQEAASRVFDRFFQADKSRSREGIGLGLSLAKRIIDILGGEISVQSQPSQGSTFTVRIQSIQIKEEVDIHGHPTGTP